MAIRFVLILLLLAGCGSEEKAEKPTKTTDKTEKNVFKEEGSFSDEKSKGDVNIKQIVDDIESNKLPDAKTHIFQELKKQPTNSELWMLGGIYFLKLGKADLAKVYLDRSYEFGNRSANLYTNRAVWFFYKRRNWEAINELQLALKADPGHLNANMMMAEALISKSNFEGGCRYLRRILDQGSDTQDIRKMNAACLIYQKNFDEAAKILSSLPQNRGMGFENAYNLIFALKRSKRSAEASQAYQRALSYEDLDGRQKESLKKLLGG